MSMASSLTDLEHQLKASPTMPAVFLGHGTPMNVTEDNPYNRAWSELGRALPKPQAILVISAHWMTKGATLVDVSAHPRTIYDFFGFPEELYAEKYPANGHPELASEVANILSNYGAQTDVSWGLDHGAWMLLKFMYPDADVPVFQVSVDITKDMAWQLQLGKSLSRLRDKGVLILGSGNLVHNLRELKVNGAPQDWAMEFDTQFTKNLNGRNFNALADTQSMGSLIHMAHPTLEHYAPAMVIAGASSKSDNLIYTAKGFDLGSVSMRSFVFHGA